jgi:hypothetical protein
VRFKWKLIDIGEKKKKFSWYNFENVFLLAYAFKDFFVVEINIKWLSKNAKKCYNGFTKMLVLGQFVCQFEIFCVLNSHIFKRFLHITFLWRKF